MPTSGEKKRRSHQEKKRKATGSPVDLTTMASITTNLATTFSDTEFNCPVTPSPQCANPTDDQCPKWAQVLCNQMSEMNKRLQNIDISLKSVCSKVDKLENRVYLTIRKVEEMSEDLSTVKTRITDVEHSVQYYTDTVDDMKSSNTSNNETIQSLQDKMDRSHALNSALREDVLDLKTRSMRDNIVFYNIQETEEENTESVIRGFCANKLEMGHKMHDIKIDRTHRIGRKLPGKCRPIVAKFNFYKDKEEIRHRAHKLRGTVFGISDQYPDEIRERRRELIPILKDAKANGQRASLVVDKLYINGKQYKKP